MRISLTALAAASIMTLTAANAQDGQWQFGWNTTTLPGTQIIAANVVRKPHFAGEAYERDQAINRATLVLNKDYCASNGQKFVADPGLVIFDKAYAEWMVGGICR